MKNQVQATVGTQDGGFVRIPGLLRAWEIEQILEPGPDFHIEAAGEAEDGTPLFAVYRRPSNEPDLPLPNSRSVQGTRAAR